MSELVVGSIAGLAANSYVVDVASGSTLDLSAGAVLPSGSVIQVVSSTYGTQQTKSGATGYTDTGLSATITPTSASSKILVLFHQTGLYKTGADIVMQLKLLRDSTSLINFDSAVAGNAGNGTNYVGGSGSAYLDSPSTTSAITYKTQYQANASGGTIGVQMLNSASTMTLLEVAG